MWLLFYMAHWLQGGSDMTNWVLERFFNYGVKKTGESYLNILENSRKEPAI